MASDATSAPGYDETLETARQALRHLAASAQSGEATPRLLALCDPGIEVDASRRIFNPAVYAGREGMRRLVREMWEAWDGFFHEEEELIADGDRVLSIHIIGGRGRASGAEARSRSALLFTVEGGIVTRVVAYSDPDEARRDLLLPG